MKHREYLELTAFACVFTAMLVGSIVYGFSRSMLGQRYNEGYAAGVHRVRKEAEELGKGKGQYVADPVTGKSKWEWMK